MLPKLTLFQIGVTSAGIGCGEEGVPSIYTDVTKGVCFIDWAAKCHFGESKFQISSKCKNWAQEKLCKIKQTFQNLRRLVSSSTYY